MALSDSSRRLLRLCFAAGLLAAPALACSRSDSTPYVTPLPSATASPTPADTAVPATATRQPATATPTASLTPFPIATDTFPATPTKHTLSTPLPLLYEAQAGDTLRTVAIRFGVLPADIHAADPALVLPADGLLQPQTLLLIPGVLESVTSAGHLFPDSAVVYSPAFARFDVNQYVREQSGYLAGPVSYKGSQVQGGEMLRHVAFNNSFSPKLLLALLENSSGWVTQKTPAAGTIDYPFGLRDAPQGLHGQLIHATNLLGIGYYGWRDASLLNLKFGDGSQKRLAPDLNAGTVAVMYYFSRSTRNEAEWQSALDAFLQTYKRLFGQPTDNQVEPLYHLGLTQPEMNLPFLTGQKWAFTGGPHSAWENEGARAALDFAPPTEISGCQRSDLYATAVAPGLVVRSYDGVVVLDLDGDGLEQTGWVVLYLHIAAQDRVPVGAQLEAGDPVGHPSCEGGVANGTHLHMARKFNGEWMLAGGPVPFNLSGWIAQAGELPYQGIMRRGADVAVASAGASVETLVWR